MSELRGRAGRVVLVAACALAVLATAPPVRATRSPSESDDLRILTLPPAPGAVFIFDDMRYVTAADGSATIPDAGDLKDVSLRLHYDSFEGDPSTEVTFNRFAGLGNANRTRQVTALFTTSRMVTFTFKDLAGDAVDLSRIDQLKLKSSLGVFFELSNSDLGTAIFLPALRVVPGPQGMELKEIYYTVQDVLIDGSNTVNRSQQKFYPAKVSSLEVVTQFFHVTVSVSDALFGFENGSAVLVRWPDGAETRHEVHDGKATLPLLPRGEYEMRVDGVGMVTWRPVSVSRDQVINLELMSAIDIGAVLLVLVVIATMLIVIGRRRANLGRRAATAVPAPVEAEASEMTELASEESDSESNEGLVSTADPSVLGSGDS